MTLAFFFSGCKSDDEPIYNETANKLKGTTWHFYKKVRHYANRDETIYSDVYWTFLSESYDKIGYKMLIKGVDSTYLSWYVNSSTNDEDESLWIVANPSNNIPEGFAQAICCNRHYIFKMTDTELVIGDSTHEIYLEKMVYDEFESVNNGGNNDNSGNNNNGGNNGSGNSGGDNPSYETPDIGFYDYTAYPTRLKVQFEIYNQDKARVTSATGFYGTSSASNSTSASVSGRIITLNISGLSSGTKYKVKVKATGAGGTSTSETVTCMTIP